MKSIHFSFRLLSKMRLNSIFSIQLPAFLLIANLIHGTLFGQVLPSPVAQFNLDGNALDASSNANHGTSTAIIATSDRFGNPNSAVTFNGVSSFIDIPDNNAYHFGTGDFSVSCWFKTGSTASILSLVNKANSGISPFTGIICFLNFPGNGQIQCRTESGKSVSSTGFIANNDQWHQYVYTRQGTVQKLYIDGILNNTSNPGFINNVTNNFIMSLGRNNFGPVQLYSGAMDDFRLFNQALSSSQVSNLFGTTQNLPGSGNAIGFDGTDDLIDLTGTATQNEFSLEMWVKPGSTQGSFATLMDNNHGAGKAWVIQQNGTNTNQYFFGLATTTNSNNFVLFNLNPNVWQHLTITKSASQVQVFINGIQIQSTPTSGTMIYNTTQQIRLGRTVGLAGNWKGEMDEVRIWSTPLSQTQIRDRMCLKITSGDALFSNLMAYYNFDETSGNTAFDGTANGNNGTLANSPTRVTSGAAIGNTSAHNYGGAVSSVNLSHPTRNDDVTATLTSGSADGVQVYCVTEAPNSSTALAQIAGNDGYFGVFPIGGSSPSFSTVYNYEGIVLGATPENKLVLSKRDDNASTTWSNTGAILNETAKTLTAGSNRSEFIVSINSSQAVQKPGSGNAISLDGIDDRISLPGPNASQKPNTALTVEAWIFSTSNSTDYQGIVCNTQDNGGDEAGYYLTKRSNGNIDFQIATTSSGFNNGPSVAVPLNKWIHVAATYDGSSAKIYINGILSASQAITGLIDWTTGSTNTIYRIGAYEDDTEFYGFQGQIDEVKVWNTALTQTQIRDRMCRKITSGDALFSNLVAYYNFDETSGNTAFDGTAYANNGTLANGPTRVTSGAAIGNTSTQNYVSTGFPSANLGFNGQDNLSVSYTAGTFTGEAGTHVYSVSEKPNTEAGIENPGTNNRYFGVFSAGLTNPQYTATYNYNGNNFVTAGNESQLGLFKRNDNAITSWSNASATLNTTAKTLTAGGQSTEYVLGVSNCTIPPTPTISVGGPTTFCAGGSVVLTSSAATGNVWSNGETTKSITVSGSGNFSVQQILAGCSSAVSVSKPVVVNTAPISAVITSPSGISFCSGSSITLQSDQSSFQQWQRNGADINGQTGPNLTVSTAGTYTIVRSQNGCTSASNALTITEDTNIPPIPIIASGGQTSFCQNATLGIISSASTGNQWLLNDNPILGETANNFIAKAPGSYKVQVKIGSCSRTSGALVLSVLPVPTVAISSSAPGICPDGTVTLSTTGSALSAREWVLNGTSLGVGTTTLSANTAGNYTVIGSSSNGCQTTSSVFVLQAELVPVLRSNKPANTICSGNPIILTSEPGTSFLWNNLATSSSITVSPTVSSKISVQTTGALGCIFNDTILVNVPPSTLPGQVSNMLPANQILNQENSISFSWQPAANAVAYDVYVWPSAQSRPVLPTISAQIEISATVRNLDFSTLYNWQITSRSACQSADGPVQQFTTRDLPDLLISNVQYPNSKVVPNTITVSYTVKNIGIRNTIPGVWKDGLYLSLDSILDSGDMEIGTVTNVSGLQPGASYNGQITGTLNESELGSFFLFVKTNLAQQSMVETNFSNNISSGNPGKINLLANTALPDLISTGPINVPELGVGEESIGFSYEVKNIGLIGAEPISSKTTFSFLSNGTQCYDFSNEAAIKYIVKYWEDQVFISSDSVFDINNAYQLGGGIEVSPKEELQRDAATCDEFQLRSDILAPNQSFVKFASARLPSNLFGKKFLHIVMNKNRSMKERTKSNNIISSNAFEMILQPPPDLNLSTITLSTAIVSIMAPLQVQYTVQNIGFGTAQPNWNDNIYISKSPVFNASAKLLKSLTISDSLVVGNSYNKSTTVQIPEGFEGSSFIHVVIGNNLFEHTFTSNNRRTQPVSVSKTNLPDLIVLDFTPINSIVQGDSAKIRIRIKNTGPRNTFAKPLVFNLIGSLDSNFASASTRFLESLSIDSLETNGIANIETKFLFPTSLSGKVFFKMNIDEFNIQSELSESNNVFFAVLGGSGPIGSGSGGNSSDPQNSGVAVGSSPHIASEVLSLSSGSPVQSGFVATSVVRITSVDPGITFPIEASVRFVLSNAKGELSSTVVPVLFSDTNPRNIQTALTFPISTQGSHKLSANLSLGAQQFRDIDPLNNSITNSIELQRPALPDLTIEAVEPVSTLTAGSLFSIPIKIKNLAANALQDNTIQRAYLSNDPNGISFVAYIGSTDLSKSILQMPTGQSVLDTLFGSIPTNVSGNFFLVVNVDANESNFEGEAGELNNQFVRPIIISPPPATDLVPDSVILPASIVVGKIIGGSLLIRNNGPGQATGTIENLLRASKTDVFNPETDGEIGVSSDAINLVSGGKKKVSFSGQTPGILPGNYFGLGQINTKFNLFETNLSNNSKKTETPVSVTIPTISLDNQLTFGQFDFGITEIGYFQANVASGLDLLMEYSGKDGYASANAIPTKAKADFRRVKNPFLNQVLIPETEAGTYFFGVEPAIFDLGTALKIKVKALPFGVQNIFPTVVGAGVVSTEITGAGFTNQTIFQLKNTQGIVVATGQLLSLTSRMQARIKWDLTGIPFAQYSVSVKKNGIEGVVAANALTVEALRKGRLVTERIGSSRVRAGSTALQVVRFINDGNVNIEYALGLTTFLGIAQAKNITVSENAFFLGKLHEKAGIRCNKLTKQSYFDLFVQIPVFYKDLGPGEEFVTSFNLKNSGGTNGLPIARQGFNLSKNQFMTILAEEVEKIRFVHTIQPNAFLGSVHKDSAFNSFKFRRAAFRSLADEKFITSAMANQFLGGNYQPDMTVGNMRGYGIVRNPNAMIERSALTIMGNNYSLGKLPANRNLTPFLSGNTFATYSSAFFMPLSNFVNLAAKNGFNPKLTLTNGTVNLNLFNRNNFLNLTLTGNKGGGIIRRNIFGPLILLYHNTRGSFPNFPPFPVPPPNITPAKPDPNNPFAPFQGPDFVPQEKPEPDPDSEDWTFDIDFDNAVSTDVPPEADFDLEMGDPTSPDDCTPIPADESGIGLTDCITDDYSPQEGRCGTTYQMCRYKVCTFAPLLFAGECDPGESMTFDLECIEVSVSCDPNEIAGPDGFGDKKMVGKTKDLAYTIKFENDPKFATAAAQTVRVIQALDPNFKPSSFLLGNYGFNNQQFSIPIGQNTFSTQLDFSAEKGIKVNVAAALDLPGNRLIWSFSTIDAFTGLPSFIPEKGFLPVNDSTGKGEGFVSYSIKGGESTVTGDSLRAQASIFFDFNEPVITNKHFNIVDALPPTTSVTSPSATQVETDIAFTWTANDDAGGSGVARTWILFKKDAGPLDTLDNFPADTGSVVVSGFETGHTYQFFFRTVDNVDNQEALATTANMTITIGTLCNDPAPTVSAVGPLTFCQGGSVVLISDKPTGNLWSNGETTQSITVSAGGSFTVKTVIAGCTSAISVPEVVTVNPLPAKPVLTPNGPLTFCQGGSVSIATNAADGHRWSTGSSLNSISVTTSLTLADTAKALGCKNVSDPLIVTVNPLPTVNAGTDVVIQAGQSANLTATGANSYLWSPLQNINPTNGVGALVTVSPIQNILYTVTGTDANNCSASDQVLVTVSGGTGPLSAPVISPTSGTFNGIQTVTITSSNPGADIYFTTTGNIPNIGTSFTRLYTGPFQVLQTTTVRAMAVKTGQANSPASTSFITITNSGIVANPVISPGSGSFDGSVTVSISSATSGAEIWFTTNGNNPRLDVPNSFTKPYTGPLTFVGTSTIKAIATKSGLINSAMVTANFVVNTTATVANPTFSPAPGNYLTAQTVTMSSTTPEAQIFYTSNGNTPRFDVFNTFTKPYAGPISINGAVSFKAVARKTGFLNSSISVGNYTIGPVRQSFENEEASFYFESESTETDGLESKIKVVPNPSQGRFRIMAPPSGEESKISILNILGQTIFEGKIEKDQIMLEVDISKQPTGIYLVKYQGIESTQELRITKY